jgi:hypothetical protein
MKYALLCLALIALPACSLFHPAKGEGAAASGTPASYARNTFEGSKATPAERAACQAAGGEIVPSGKLQWENCVQAFPDAGQTCSGDADCAGECLYDGEEVEPGTPVAGTCQADDARFGCRTVVEDGKIAHTLCVD